MTDRIAHVEFQVSYENDAWEALVFFGEVFTDRAFGETPVSAMIAAEVLARKHQRRHALADAFEAGRQTGVQPEGDPTPGEP